MLQLKDINVKLFFARVTVFAGEELALMNKWARSPWPTNLVNVAGLAPLRSNSEGENLEDGTVLDALLILKLINYTAKHQAAPTSVVGPRSPPEVVHMKKNVQEVVAYGHSADA